MIDRVYESSCLISKTTLSIDIVLQCRSNLHITLFLAPCSREYLHKIAKVNLRLLTSMNAIHEPSEPPSLPPIFGKPREPREPRESYRWSSAAQRVGRYVASSPGAASFPAPRPRPAAVGKPWYPSPPLSFRVGSMQGFTTHDTRKFVQTCGGVQIVFTTGWWFGR